jgi:hypothetical protein
MIAKKEVAMPRGKGTYGSKRGRPPKLQTLKKLLDKRKKKRGMR